MRSNGAISKVGGLVKTFRHLPMKGCSPTFLYFPYEGCKIKFYACYVASQSVSMDLYHFVL